MEQRAFPCLRLRGRLPVGIELGRTEGIAPIRRDEDRLRPRFHRLLRAVWRFWSAAARLRNSRQYKYPPNALVRGRQTSPLLWEARSFSDVNHNLQRFRCVSVRP